MPESKNAFLPIDSTEFGMSILVRLVQSMNAPVSITLTELGIITLVKPEHSLNRPDSILSKELGNTTLFKSFFLRNAKLSISVTGYVTPSYVTAAGIVILSEYPPIITFAVLYVGLSSYLIPFIITYSEAIVGRTVSKEKRNNNNFFFIGL